MQFYRHYTLVSSKSIGQEILIRIQARGGCLVKKNWTAKSQIIFITAFNGMLCTSEYQIKPSCIFSRHIIGKSGAILPTSPLFGYEHRDITADLRQE